MSSTAEQHSSIFSTLTLKNSFIAACNDIRTFFLEHQIYTVFFCTLTQLSDQFFSLKTTSFNFLEASIPKLKYLYLFAPLNPENTVYLCFHVIYDVVVKVPTLCRFEQSEKSCSSNYTNVIKISDCLRAILILFIY